jgi:hypothetical protein
MKYFELSNGYESVKADKYTKYKREINISNNDIVSSEWLFSLIMYVIMRRLKWSVMLSKSIKKSEYLISENQTLGVRSAGDDGWWSISSIKKLSVPQCKEMAAK